MTCSAVSVGEFRLAIAAIEPPRKVSHSELREHSGRVSLLEAHLSRLDECSLMVDDVL